MAKPILIRGARQLLTLQGPAGPRRGAALRELGIIKDGAILVREGRIDQIGPSRRVEALVHARDADVLEAAGKVVLPGFVDAHTHLIGGPLRFEECHGALPPEAFWKPLQRTSRHTMEAQGMRILEDFARHGSTTIEAASGFGVYETGEIKILRAQRALNRRTSMVVSTFMGTRWRPPDAPPEEYIDWMCHEMLPLVKKRRLAEFVDICCEQEVFSAEQARCALTSARRLGLIPKMHAGKKSEIGGVLEGVRMGVASINHAVLLSESEIDALARSNTVATILPGPVFFTGAGCYAPARRMIDRGVAVALGTGYNSETCPAQSMQWIIALACTELGMTPAEAISAATINAAHALCRENRVGSLQPDKAADLIVLDVADYREIPSRLGSNLVNTTIKDGRVIWRRGPVRWPV